MGLAPGFSTRLGPLSARSGTVSPLELSKLSGRGRRSPPSPVSRGMIEEWDLSQMCHIAAG